MTAGHALRVTLHDAFLKVMHRLLTPALREFQHKASLLRPMLSQSAEIWWDYGS